MDGNKGASKILWLFLECDCAEISVVGKTTAFHPTTKGSVDES